MPTLNDLVLEKKSAMEAELKKHSKDAIVKREKATSEDKEAIAAYFKAVASNNPADWAKSNEIQAKAYEEKNIEWRDEAELKTKAQTVGTAAQGGNLVPTTLRNSIIEKMYYISPMRQMSTVIDNMPAILDMPVDNALPTTYWVGEGVAITESGITFTKKQLVPYKLAGLDSFTSESLADTAVNPSLQNLVEDRYATALALAENAAFVSGDGVSKPFGFRSSDITPTAVTGNTTAGNLAYGDVLRQMFTIGTAYRMRGVFVTSSYGVSLLLGIKDSAGRPIFLPGDQGLAGASAAPATLFQRPLYVVDEIPNNLGAGTNETELWYGDFKNYWIGDRGAMRTDYGTNGTDFAQDKISLRMIERVAGRPFLDVVWTKMNIK
jgi:HK97 family phage major capsid protein